MLLQVDLIWPQQSYQNTGLDADVSQANFNSFIDWHHRQLSHLCLSIAQPRPRAKIVKELCLKLCTWSLGNAALMMKPASGFPWTCPRIRQTIVLHSHFNGHGPTAFITKIVSNASKNHQLNPESVMVFKPTNVRIPMFFLLKH